MTLRKLASASAALLFVTGAALAQTGTANNSKGGSGTNLPPFASENEQMMYEQNKDALAAFFTDDTMTTLRSEDEIKQSWASMDQGQQAGLRAACQQAMDDSGSYGESTNTICTNVMGR
ncbi:MAG: hypothetical protein M9939_14775 [Mesorhizobium sp.]|nr:hypothetical protein [Mesorhizobium sp.]MCO5162394.1 hypothetical protein [Mesorhizobium sp.]